MSTLRFGVRAKRMVNKPRANKERSAAELKAALELKEVEIARLKRRVAALEGLLPHWNDCPPPPHRPPSLPFDLECACVLYRGPSLLSPARLEAMGVAVARTTSGIDDSEDVAQGRLSRDVSGDDSDGSDHDEEIARLQVRRYEHAWGLAVTDVRADVVVGCRALCRACTAVRGGGTGGPSPRPQHRSRCAA